MRGQSKRIPDIFAVDDFSGRAGDNAEESKSKLYQWQKSNLIVNRSVILEVPSEIRNTVSRSALQQYLLAKTTHFVAIVAQPPVIEDIDERMSHDRMLP